MIIFLGHLHMACNQIDIPSNCRHSLSLLRCFDTIDISQLKPIRSRPIFLLKPIGSCPMYFKFCSIFTNDVILLMYICSIITIVVLLF